MEMKDDETLVSNSFISSIVGGAATYQHNSTVFNTINNYFHKRRNETERSLNCTSVLVQIMYKLTRRMVNALCPVILNYKNKSIFEINFLFQPQWKCKCLNVASAMYVFHVF